MRAYSQSAGYAEQALSAIKVVHTYGQETLEMSNYNKYLARAKAIGRKQVVRRSFGASLLFCIIFGFYGYSFYFGGYLRYNGFKNGDREYTGGVVIAIMFSVVFGAFNLGGAGPHIASIAEGRIAGKLAFSIIDKKPEVNSNESGKKVLRHEDIKGKIELKNINFTFPTK